MTHKFANADWELATRVGGGPVSNEHVTFALLMDIRGELKKLNALLHCPNFLAIPFTLHEIKDHTKRPRKYTRKRKVKP